MCKKRKLTVQDVGIPSKIKQIGEKRQEFGL